MFVLVGLKRIIIESKDILKLCLEVMESLIKKKTVLIKKTQFQSQ